MWLAVEAVRKRDADIAVSAGNTGALMAMAKFALKTLPGIDRPAIAALWPTLRGESIVLDVGASIGADSEHLVDLAIMGAAMARILFGLERPSVGLLNIGVEEVKGLEQVREAGRLLRERYQWKGELRAIGDVLRDQLRFHARCGFDAFAVRADKDIHDALNAFGELSISYQGAVDNPEPLFRRRGAVAGASA